MKSTLDGQTVRFLDLQQSHAALRASLMEAFARVLHSGWYVLGKEVRAFEQEFSNYCEAKHGVGVSNGLDALPHTPGVWDWRGKRSHRSVEYLHRQLECGAVRGVAT